jgi:hypothetical protein
MKLTSGGRTALWVGTCGLIGLAVGALITNPGEAARLSPMWFIAMALYVGLVIGIGREKGERAANAAKLAPSPATSAAPAPAPGALDVRFELPDVPAHYPSVLGRGEPVQVRVRVLSQGQPAEGAAVQLHASMGEGTLAGDGITGTDGTVEFTLEPEELGDLSLTAEAKAASREGRASSVVTIVHYEHEIERLFGEFRQYAIGVLGPEAHADTARELCDRLRVRADPATARALLELARVYELVAYGERVADRRLYLAVLEQLMVLEHAELPDAGARVTREA